MGEYDWLVLLEQDNEIGIKQIHIRYGTEEQMRELWEKGTCFNGTKKVGLYKKVD